jgi:hydrogenase/urease accessory protein HupE
MTRTLPLAAVGSRLTRAGLAAIVAFLCGVPQAQAHPVPYSYVDVRVRAGGIDVTIVAHAYDLSHDLGLGVETPDRILDQAVLDRQAEAIARLLDERLRLSADGRVLQRGRWSAPEPLLDRQSVRLRTEYPFEAAVGVVNVDANFFPYDPQHQTFVNVYEGDALRLQSILGGGRTSLDYFAGTTQGTIAVVRKFIPSGVHHILIGPDHLLFLVGLLLMGGTMRQLLLVVTAFTVAHSITLSLAALNIFTPPARIIEPAIALSIVYVGADNLMVGSGRDVRGWIAFAFGFIHGFGFANVLREMELPRQAMGWTLFSFNLGVEVGQVIVVAIVASALLALRARSEAASRRLAYFGSIGVMVAGAYWFVQRVFFSGGMT